MNNGVEERITWGELYSDCQKIMRSLEGLDGGVVLIFLRHDKMLFGSFFGAMMSGNIPSFMPCSSSKQDPILYWGSHQDLMSHIRPSAIISKHIQSVALPIGDDALTGHGMIDLKSVVSILI